MVISTLGAFIAIGPAHFEAFFPALFFCAICAVKYDQTHAFLKLNFIFRHSKMQYLYELEKHLTK